MLHGLLSFRNNRSCYICGKYEDNLDHLLFQCPSLAHARNLVKEWLEIAGIDQDNFNRHTLIEMTKVDTLQNNVITNYKDIILKNRKLAQWHDVKINEQAIINSLNYNIRFYINHIAKLYSWALSHTSQILALSLYSYRNLCLDASLLVPSPELGGM